MYTNLVGLLNSVDVLLTPVVLCFFFLFDSIKLAVLLLKVTITVNCCSYI